MTNESEFKLALQAKEPTIEHKIECCQYFIDNYPVTIRNDGFEIFTKLQNIKIIPPFNLDIVDYAYNQLKDRFLNSNR